MGIARKMTAKQENTHQQEAPPPAVSVAANATVTTWSTFVIHLATSSNASHLLIYIHVWTPAHHPKNTRDIFKFESKIRCSKTLQIQQLWLTVAILTYITHQLQEKRNLFYFFNIVLCCVLCTVYCVLLCTVYCCVLCTVLCCVLCTVVYCVVCIVYCCVLCIVYCCVLCIVYCSVLCIVYYCVLFCVVYCVLLCTVYCVLCIVYCCVLCIVYCCVPCIVYCCVLCIVYCCHYWYIVCLLHGMNCVFKYGSGSYSYNKSQWDAQFLQFIS